MDHLKREVQIYGQREVEIDRYMDRLMDGQIEVGIDGQREEEIDRQIYGYIDGWIDRGRDTQSRSRNKDTKVKEIWNTK